MLFEYGHVQKGQTALILGAAGNVGGYAVQLAAIAGVHVYGIARPRDVEFVKDLGAEVITDDQDEELQDVCFDVIIDTVGGEILERAFRRLKLGGTLVSVVSRTPCRSVQACSRCFSMLKCLQLG